MERIVAASRNRNKIREIGRITGKFGIEIISRDDAGVPKTEIEEDGTTFEENSYKKAFEIMKLCGMPTLADDSGIEVDCIGKAPGVYSARFAQPEVSETGEKAEDADAEMPTNDPQEIQDKLNNKKLISMIRDFSYEERRGRFVCVITMVWPDGRKLTARGEVEGHILLEERGDGGFGYDPLFVPLGHNRTFAEMSSEEKNSMSHRGKALTELARLLSAQYKK
ncbi:MAG TPA: RdgB/HAM1 family non-canonical purine NTP pyrophosphatase [Bacillota bacterium]|nr:RdgB/HAM1 family non-canonical purine NTP pyrophosphatase [Bacillota bacterium]